MIVGSFVEFDDLETRRRGVVVAIAFDHLMTEQTQRNFILLIRRPDKTFVQRRAIDCMSVDI